MSPARHVGPRRWPVLALVVAVLAGLAVAARSPGKSPTGGPPPAPAAMVSAPDVESSAWYCTGQTTVSGTLAPGPVILTNTGDRAVTGSIHAATDTGARVARAFAVPARGQLVADLPPPKSGTWLSDVVTLSGGGVAVTQAVHGSSGWAEAPCQSSTSRQWFFPSGVTSGSDALFVALFNPTSSPDVVDLSFVTPKGIEHPINFQGIVLQPDQTQVESVSPFVQDQPSVATTVSTRTGRLVASELQLVTGDGAGIAIVPGSPTAEQRWTIPQSAEAVGGSSSIDVFNPGTTTQEVTVRTRLASGPLSPFRARVLPETTWVLPTSAQTRIPKGDPYSAVIEAKGGSGVVVGRVVVSPSSAPSPQDGMANAVDALSAASPAHRWVVPSPGTAANPVFPGAFAAHVALTNVSGGRETYVVVVIRPSGRRVIASGALAASASLALGDLVLSRAGRNPLLVTASGPAAVSEVAGPADYGVVTMPGIPLSG